MKEISFLTSGVAVMRKFVLLALFLLPAALYAANDNICLNSTGAYFTAPKCDANQYLNVTVQSTTPGTDATSLGKAEDAGHTSGDTGVFILGVNGAYGDGRCSNSGDYCPVSVSNNGFINLMGTFDEDVGRTAADRLFIMGAVRDDALVANQETTTDLDYGPVRTDNYGANWTHPIIFTNTLTATPTIEAAAYASGDCLMAAAAALTGTAATAPFLGGRITDVVITDLAAQASNIDVVFFNADPGNICAAINAAADIDDDDLAKVVAIVPVTTHFALNDNSVSEATNVNIKYTLASGTALYYGLISRGTPTYGTTADLVIKVKVELD